MGRIKVKEDPNTREFINTYTTFLPHLTIHSFFYSKQVALSVQCMPGTVLGTWDSSGQNSPKAKTVTIFLF